MDINNFIRPNSHPYGLLKGYDNAYQKENVLAIILINALEEEDLYAPFKTSFPHPTMVDDGLLEEVGVVTYRLTKKSVGLLYTVYGV